MPEPTRIADTLRSAARRLQRVSDSPRLDAELLLSHAARVPRSYLYAHPDHALDAAALQRFETTVSRRLDGEPLAYISGAKEFWSMRLIVTPDTLVPRPETEMLVELALQCIPLADPCRALDLGTGSGAIALAIARERPRCEVVATDRSAAALAVAAVNARELSLPNVTFLHGDWTAPVAGDRFDVIVANPPYVATGDAALDALHAEPRSALVAGPDGLDAIRTLATATRYVVRRGGRLLLEHGDSQQQPVAAILSRNGWSNVRCTSDFAGKPRVTSAEWPAATPLPATANTEDP